jgi:hypothetical protein
LKRASISIGAPLLENMEGRSFPRAFERSEKILYLGKFYEEFERYVEKALYRGSSI